MIPKTTRAKQLEESVSLNPAVIGQMAQSFVIGLLHTGITAMGGHYANVLLCDEQP